MTEEVIAEVNQFKPVRFRTDKWIILNRFAKEISAELGVEVSLPDAAIYAITRLNERATKK